MSFIAIVSIVMVAILALTMIFDLIAPNSPDIFKAAAVGVILGGASSIYSWPLMALVAGVIAYQALSAFVELVFPLVYKQIQYMRLASSIKADSEDVPCAQS